MLIVQKLWDRAENASLDKLQRRVSEEVGISDTHLARPFVDYATAHLAERLKARIKADQIAMEAEGQHEHCPGRWYLEEAIADEKKAIEEGRWYWEEEILRPSAAVLDDEVIF
jgi:hypothetical protein